MRQLVGLRLRRGAARLALPWHYLGDAEVHLCLGIYGTPWVTFLASGWAFQAPRSFSSDFIRERFSLIPESSDIILGHTPPSGYGDSGFNQLHNGSTALPGTDWHDPLVAFSHAHDAPERRGITQA